MTFAIRVALIGAALAARAWAGESATMRAADAGIPPAFCPTLRTLVDAADNAFTTVRGKVRVGGEHVWEATKRLPGASECTVYGGRPAAYSCALYVGDVEHNADATYDRAVSALRDCLPAGWTTTEQIKGTYDRTTTAAGTAGPQVRVILRDASADAYLVEVWVDAAGH